MYTVGYLQTYGVALLVASLPGLVAAVFSQGAIVAFYRLVERPHYQRLYGGVAATTARRLRTSQEPGWATRRGSTARCTRCTCRPTCPASGCRATCPVP